MSGLLVCIVFPSHKRETKEKREKKMGYIKKVVDCGDVIDVLKYRETNGRGRRKAYESNGTSEEQKKINERKNINTLAYKIATNFSREGIHLTLTYKKEIRPESREKAEKELTNFLRKARAEQKKRGKNLKYLARTEEGQSGKNFHHHIIMNITDAKILKKIWKNGFIRIVPLNKYDDYKKLAKYLIKEETKNYSWRSSKGLKSPKIKKEKLKNKEWRKEPKPKKGFAILKNSIENGITGWGAKYQRYTMVRIRE